MEETKKCPKCAKKLKWDSYMGRWECMTGPRDRKPGCGFIHDPKPNSEVDIVTYEKQDGNN